MRLAAAPAWAFSVCLLCERFVFRRYVGMAALGLGAMALTLWAVQLWRRRYRFEHAAIETDRLADAQGLLLTRLETPVGEWGFELNNKLKALRVPFPNVRLPVLQLVLLALLVSVGLWWPLKPQQNAIANRAATHTLEEIAEQLQVLREAEGANPTFDAELQKLKELAREGDFSASEWQAADALQAAVSTEAENASSRLDAAANAAQALDDARNANASVEETRRAEEELERALMALSSPDGRPSGGPPPTDPGSQKPGSPSNDPTAHAGDTGAAKPGGASSSNLSQEQLAALRDSLEKKRAALEKQRAEKSGGEASPREASRTSGSGQRPGGSQPGTGRDGRGKGAGQGTSKQAGQGQANAKGQGGAPARGGSHVPVEFGPESELHPERLAVAPMPKGNGGDPEVYYGLKSAAPPQGPQNGAATSVGGAAGPATAGFRPSGVLPRNEGVVKRYFQSTTPGAP